MVEKLNKHRFFFEELVKRDFKKKYRRTILGMGRSMLMPLLPLLARAQYAALHDGSLLRHGLPVACVHPAADGPIGALTFKRYNTRFLYYV